MQYCFVIWQQFRTDACLFLKSAYVPNGRLFVSWLAKVSVRIAPDYSTAVSVKQNTFLNSCIGI